MSLSAWEQQALDSIKDRLAASDPQLAGLLSAFSRLASGEEMPAREAIGVGPRRAARHPRRKRRHRADQVSRYVHRVREILGSRRLSLLLWLVITITLIAITLALNIGSAPATCRVSWAMSCVNSAPAHASPKGVQATSAGQRPRSTSPGAGG